MSATLVALAGPLQGEIVRLDTGGVLIGRESSNHLSIPDLALSRQHCRIDASPGEVTLRDLDSLNGTFINDVPVKERILQHGDQIRLGDSVLLFLCRNTEPTGPPDVRIHHDGVPSNSTAELRPDEIVYCQPDDVLARLRPARLARDLHALYAVSIAIPAIRERQVLLRELLDRAFEAVPADFGAVMLLRDDRVEFGEVHGRHRGADGPVPISHTITSRVLANRTSVLSNDVPGEFQFAESAIAAHIHSTLCVPLISSESLLGVVYLAATAPAVRFDSEHLQLLTAIASIGAVSLANLSRLIGLEEDKRRLQADLHRDRSMVGESPRLRRVFDIIARAARTDSTVLILGESGTGKELVARAIHASSNRKGRPFVAVNCATLTESLLESELFGNEKGAFTGAVAQKKGRLEMAHGGTVFLDEIGELTPSVQAKLLRVLQEREFERVGGIQPIKVDIRIVAATNRDLDAAAAKSDFRRDLYYRLNVVTITTPALRDRKEDIPLLAAYFVAKYAQRCKRRVKGLSPASRDLLLNYDWPGNIRELENTIERAVVLGSSEQILPEDLPEAVLDACIPSDGAQVMGYHAAIREAKRRAVMQALRQSTGSRPDAARLLGLHRNNLDRLIRTLGLKAELEP